MSITDFCPRSNLAMLAMLAVSVLAGTLVALRSR